jgi:hypothetical protein
MIKCLDIVNSQKIQVFTFCPHDCLSYNILRDKGFKTRPIIFNSLLYQARKKNKADELVKSVEIKENESILMDSDLRPSTDLAPSHS